MKNSYIFPRHVFIYIPHKLSRRHILLRLTPSLAFVSIPYHNIQFNPKCFAVLWMKTFSGWSRWEPDPQTWLWLFNTLPTELISYRPCFLAYPSLSSGCTSCRLPPTTLHAPWYVVLYLLRPSSSSFVGVSIPPFLATTFQKVNRSDFQ